MSLRELRDFTELMRALGYPRIIAVDNFRTPNFALVADALYWLIHRYQPHVRISDEITTEDDRVNFITRVVQVMAGRARVKLNAKRLYAADGRAVRELLKVAQLLYKAKQANLALKASTNASLSKASAIAEDAKETKSGSSKNSEGGSAATGAKPADGEVEGEFVLPQLQSTRKLANEITDSGAKLYDLLQHEDSLRRKRDNALRFLDATNSNLHNTSEHEYIEKTIREIIVSQGENVAALEKQCSDLEHDEKNLEKQIKKKKSELERSEKRLKSLQTVRPAFMDDLEKLERELKKNYELYLERFRNLDYLELQLDMHNQREKEKLHTAERNLRRMQERLRKQDEHLNRGTKAIESAYHNSKAVDTRPGREGSNVERPGASYLKYRDGAGGVGGGGGGGDRGNKARVVGDIDGGSDSTDGSLTSDSATDSDGSGSDRWGQVSLGGDGGASDSASDSESAIEDALDDHGDISASDAEDYVSDDDSGSDGDF